MSDMFVKLYALPPLAPALEKLAAKKIEIRRALVPEKSVVIKRIKEGEFPPSWNDECEIAFTRLPVSCFIAVSDGRVLGFSCYDSVMKGFFGPIGVLKEFEGKGIGKALLLSALHAMRAEGYGYAAIGWVAEPEFYRKCAGAQEIPDSLPGIYKGMLLH
ncbi:MAG: GNAT family N-acetyltransferase [Elusimicrobiaceae bacterium]